MVDKNGVEPLTFRFSGLGTRVRQALPASVTCTAALIRTLLNADECTRMRPEMSPPLASTARPLAGSAHTEAPPRSAVDRFTGAVRPAMVTGVAASAQSRDPVTRTRRVEGGLAGHQPTPHNLCGGRLVDQDRPLVPASGAAQSVAVSSAVIPAHAVAAARACLRQRLQVQQITSSMTFQVVWFRR